MDKDKLKFSRNENREFYNTLRTRVNQYFEENKLSKYGNGGSVIKTVFMFCLYYAPLILMLVGVITNPWLIALSWALMGLGIAGIGMGVMHDANHGSYSKNKTINNILGHSLNLLGGNSHLWKLQHNVLHHTFTNVEGVDEDLNGRSFLRFSPHQKHRKVHRFQHIYAWGFYSLLTLNWVTASDFMRAKRYRKKGLIKSDKELKKQYFQIGAWKLLYFSYALVLPLILIPASPWLIIGCFFGMHFIAGFCLSIIFQTAHVMTSADFPLPDENQTLQNSWAVHQIETTSNYAPGSRILSWLVGGLNFQIEHHLFTNISHVHYKKLSKIVAATSEEFGITYRTHRTFLDAVRDHAGMLRQLGRMEEIPSNPNPNMAVPAS